MSAGSPSSEPPSALPPGTTPPGTPPPSIGSDAFTAARAAAVRRFVRVGLAIGALLLVGAVVVGLLSGRGARRPARPLGVVAWLRATSLASPVDAPTGYQRLASLLPPGAELEAGALAEDGTLAIAISEGERRLRLVLMHDAQTSAVMLEGPHVSVLAFTPASELYVGFDDGQISTLATGAPATALLPAARGAAPASTVTGFAFDRATKKTAVVFAGGEVFTALRPFRADALHAVVIPPNARVRLAAFTGDSDLVLAGDRGQVFVSSGNEWDALPLPTSGMVVALATDLAGEILVAQSNGQLFQRDRGWESLGQTPAPPVAIGELGALGVVAVLSDGRVVQAVEAGVPRSIAGYERRGPATSGQIAGVNVLVLSRERLIVAEPGDKSRAWWSDAYDPALAGRMPHMCRVLGANSNRVLAPPLPMVWCLPEGAVILGAAGVRRMPAQRVSGLELDANELLRLLREGRGATYISGQVLREHDESELPSLLAYRLPERRYLPLVVQPAEEGAIVDWSAAAGQGGAFEIATMSATGALRFARIELTSNGALPSEPIAAELIAGRAALEVLRASERLPLVHVLGGGRVLLAYAGSPTLIATLDVAVPGRIEPVSVRPDPPETSDGDRERYPVVLSANGVAWLARPGLLERVGASSGAIRIADGNSLVVDNGTVVVDERGGLHALATRVSPRRPFVRLVLDCDAAGCAERPLPTLAGWLQLFIADGGKLGVLERDGTIGLFTR